ncbi:MAG TPA: hypothetical protein VGM88_10745 [Kofleriaceae bacterium]|jgi:hypothetical protein
MTNVLPFRRRPQVLFICGNHNHTTMMHAIARAFPECDAYFTPYYCDPDTALDYLRRAGILEFVALGHQFRQKCIAYLHANGLAVDLGGARGTYDLAVTCSDLIVPTNLAGTPLVGVQEGMIDPQLFWWGVMQAFPWLKLPRWAAGTACTGLSNAYERYCVASDGYRDDFVTRGADPAKLVVTGLPNFDSFASHVQPGHWIEGHVLAATSDGRETFRRDDRKAFIKWVMQIARDRPVVFKLHPNEKVKRAVHEIHRWAPRAKVIASSAGGNSGETLAANCHTLVTEWSTLAYVGLALGKPTYSYRDLSRHGRMLPVQHARGAENIANVCRDVLAQRLGRQEAAA